MVSRFSRSTRVRSRPRRRTKASTRTRTRRTRKKQAKRKMDVVRRGRPALNMRDGIALVRRVYQGARGVAGLYNYGKKLKGKWAKNNPPPKMSKKRKAEDPLMNEAASKGAGSMYATGLSAGSLRGSKYVDAPMLKTCARLGTLRHNERKGTLADAHCIYFGYNAIALDQTNENLGRAIARHALFKAFGFNPSQMGQEINYSSPYGENSQHLRFQWWEQDEGNTTMAGNDNTIGTLTSTFDTTDNNSIVSVGDWIRDQLDRFTNSDTTSWLMHTHIPLRLTVTEITGTVYRRLHEVDLLSLRVHYYSRANLKIQNRTVHDSADDDRNDVNNVPLQGRVYSFPSDIKPKHSNSKFRTGGNGLFLMAGAAENAGLNGQAGLWSEPPQKFHFQNCRAAHNVNMQPGDIKSDTMTVAYNLPLMKWLTMCNAHYTTGGAHMPSKKVGAPGRIHLVALEKAMSFGNAISAVYEVDVKAGCYITTSPKKHIMTALEESTLNT